MSKRKNKKRDSSKQPESVSPVSTIGSDGVDSSATTEVFAWSKTQRQIASLAIVAYLFVLIIGPLSNPIASPHFSAPIAEKIGPIHRVLFLGHGYRFFSPDPGPSHRLLYRGVRPDGTEFSGHFPDRDNHWPRLLYHRWFMLSESLFNEQMLKPSAAQFKRRQDEYDRQILRLRTEGKRELLEQLIRERALENTFFETTTTRVNLLATRVATVLLQRNDGVSIELFVQERKIPFPEEVADGLRIDSESLLLDPIKIGELDAGGYRSFEPVEVLPAKEETQ